MGGMRFSLRTMLILLATLPPLIAWVAVEIHKRTTPEPRVIHLILSSKSMGLPDEYLPNP